jgi:hypothetical protein|tara:strand:- start:13480 stop:13776 length:297 start_codon:yes stop_codon:yes gene_type:complete
MNKNTRAYLKSIAKFANKKVGYPAGKGKYFIGSLPIGTVFELGNTRGVLIATSVNSQVTIFQHEAGANELGRKIWGWATEVEIIKLGKVNKGEENDNT